MENQPSLYRGLNYADPFGLCAKDKDGVEDANCRKLINGLNATADEADKTLPAGQTNRFREAAAGYEATDREVEFVDALDSRLNQRNYNGDGNPATFAMGRTMDDRILIGRFLGPGDVMAVATHEILVHGHEKRLYFGDYKDATVDLNRQIWSQLPARYRPSAELWRRKIQ